ncbi:MAG: aminodeoxychorismate/anthranilate synthase component II [Deltaproteobacteria bacterium]|nr:aminodeoxychorismate/anthranilate synthase component II [Deltaproteobacteria bacterium]
MRVVILDNYDSFTWNLAQLFMEQGAQAQSKVHVEVLRNDAVDLAGLAALRPDRLVLSPGPGRPEREADFGICGAVLRDVLGERPLLVGVPVLGVCLGHQGLVHALGGKVVHAPEPRHGKVSTLRNLGGRLLAGIPSAFQAMRYHSLLAERASLPSCLRVTAECHDPASAAPLVMAVEHRSLPVYGVQFHPESIGTPLGGQIAANFLSAAASLPLAIAA